VSICALALDFEIKKKREIKFITKALKFVVADVYLRIVLSKCTKFIISHIDDTNDFQGRRTRIERSDVVIVVVVVA
jgi:hypothetical protein